MIPLVFGMFGANWLVELLKKRDEYGWGNVNENIMGGHYNDGKVSDWVLKQVKTSEGLELTAYTANNDEKRAGQWTIGYGTSFLYLENGKPFNNNYSYGKAIKGGNGVKPGDTLSSLKVKMGYGNLSDSAFAEQLIINHMYSLDGSYFAVANYLDMQGVVFYQGLKDALQEFCYGSGSAKSVLKNGKINALVNAIKLRNTDLIAANYVLLRVGYYKGLKAWKSSPYRLSNRYSWLKRVYVSGIRVKGGYTSMREIESLTASRNHIKRLQNMQVYFKKNLGAVLDLVS